MLLFFALVRFQLKLCRFVIAVAKRFLCRSVKPVGSEMCCGRFTFSWCNVFFGRGFVFFFFVKFLRHYLQRFPRPVRVVWCHIG